MHTIYGTRSSNSADGHKIERKKVHIGLGLTLIKDAGHTIMTLPTTGPIPAYGFCSVHGESIISLRQSLVAAYSTASRRAR